MGSRPFLYPTVRSHLTPRRLGFSAFFEKYPVVAEVVLARNVANPEEIDEFLKEYVVEDLPQVGDWLGKTMRKFLINRYKQTRPYKAKDTDPDWMKTAQDLEKVVLDDALHLKVQHVVDFLKNKLVAEPGFKLANFQAEEAFKQAEDWVAKSKKKVADAEDEGVDYKVLMPLSDGYKWVQLLSEKSLKREGDKMGHCVGGYWERVKKGMDQIISLRDGKNEPHATIEYTPRLKKIEQIKGKSNKGVIDEYMPYVLEFLKTPPIPVSSISPHELQLNNLLKLDQGFVSMNHIPEGSVIDQDLNLKKLVDVRLPKNLTVKGNLTLKAEELPENLTVTKELDISGSSLRELPSGLNVGSLNMARTRVEKLPADLKIKDSLNLEFSYVDSLPANLKLKGDLTLSDSAVEALPQGLSVGGELDLMNTSIKVLPSDLKVGVAIFVDNEDEMEAPAALKKKIV